MLSDKIFAVEDKLSKANALFGDTLDEYFSKPKYDILSDNEMERLAAVHFLSGYPHWVLLLRLLFDITVETEKMVKKLAEEVD